MRLRKGQQVTVSCDYEWKFGEPSVYNDEQLWYLIFKINGEIVDDENLEKRILKRSKVFSYDLLLQTVKLVGDQTLTIQ